MQDKRRSRSLRWQLIVGVNSACAILLLIFLAYDYHRELDHRLRDKQVALQEEAYAVLTAVRALQHHGVEELQSFIDTVCAGMEELHSPGHHIAVRVEGRVLQALAHQRESGDVLHAIQTAVNKGEHRASAGRHEFIVGVARHEPIQVYVSEFLDTVHQEVRSDALRRFGGALLLAVVAAGIVNVLLLWLVAMPLGRLVEVVERIGSGEFDQAAVEFHSRELISLSTAIAHMSESLAEAQRQRVRQMEKARRIQQHLLPSSLQLPNAALAILYEPAEQVAGDYYDIVRLRDNSWLVCLADVAGHGTPAAMSATLLKAFLLEATEHHTDLLEILTRINRRFTATTLPEHFASMMLLRVSADSLALQFVNAGHPPALYLPTDSSIERWSSSGTLIGIDESAVWAVHNETVSSGDRLVFVSDGVIESLNREGAQYGMQRLVEQLVACRNEAADKAVSRISRDLRQFRSGNAADDVTLIIFEFT